MSLHYPVKLEMLIAHVYVPLIVTNCYQKSTIYPTSTQSSLDLNPVDNSIGKYCKRRCTKHSSLIWSYQRRHWQMVAAMKTWSSLAHSVLSRCFSSSRSRNRITFVNLLDQVVSTTATPVSVRKFTR